MSIFTRPALISTAGTFAAFRHRNYRLWFIGQLVSQVGAWMQNIAQGYLLYILTGSVAYLGYVGSLSGLLSWLLMIYGGLMADRVPRRTLLVITQSVKMMLAFILGALVFYSDFHSSASEGQEFHRYEAQVIKDLIGLSPPSLTTRVISEERIALIHSATPPSDPPSMPVVLEIRQLARPPQ